MTLTPFWTVVLFVSCVSGNCVVLFVLLVGRIINTYLSVLPAVKCSVSSMCAPQLQRRNGCVLNSCSHLLYLTIPCHSSVIVSTWLSSEAQSLLWQMFLGCAEESLVVRHSFLPEATDLNGVNFLMKGAWEKLEVSFNQFCFPVTLTLLWGGCLIQSSHCFLLLLWRSSKYLVTAVHIRWIRYSDLLIDRPCREKEGKDGMRWW